MEKFNLEKIGQFSVTDRGLEEVLKEAGIDVAEIAAIPENGTVLNIGSGLYQRFEEGLHQQRKDLKIVSIDPTLGIDVEGGDWRIEKLGGSIAQYKHQDQPKMHWGKDMSVKDPGEFQRQRVEEIRGRKYAASLAALAPDLPFAPESFDLIIDCVASMRYIQEQELRDENLRLICTLLAKGGSAYVTSLWKRELAVIGDGFEVKIIRQAESNSDELCDVKITRKK